MRLRLAIQEYVYTQNLRKKNVVSQNEVEIARGKARIIAAQVESLEEETQDELDRLQLERRRKVAQLEKARAEMEIAAALLKRNEVLNRRKPEMVAAEEVTRADGQLKVAAAQKDIAEVEVAEVDLRGRQLERRRYRIRNVLAEARDVK
jgi:multidrug resistance efflux pump